MISRRLLLRHGARATWLLPAMLPELARATSPSHPRPAATSWPRALPLVILDAGHGGKDPGAIGISGTYEKHIALAAAGELARALQRAGRVRVGLTRDGDHFIPLEERVAIAQARGAAQFVSIHADALGDPAVRGASVYTLADGASDTQTAALARRENAADRFAAPAVQAASPEVAGILASLVRHETRVGSAHLARGMVSALGREVTLLQNPVRHAGFVVLKASDIPSVLVEMGFMSSPRDEAELLRPAHRARVTGAMAQAIVGYFAPAGPALPAGQAKPSRGAGLPRLAG